MCRVGLDDDDDDGDGDGDGDDGDGDDGDDDSSDEALTNVVLLIKSFIASFKLSKSCSHKLNFSDSC